MGPFFERLRKYWMVLVAALLFGFFGFRAWPEGDELSPTKAGALSTGMVRDLQFEQKQAEKEPSPDASARRQSKPPPAQLPPKYEFVEVPMVVEPKQPSREKPKTYTQDSPEVKKALSELKIRIYGQADSDQAKQAREYLEHNGLSYTFFDTKDAMEQERARRLSGKSEGTVIVIDDQVLDDYSPEVMQKTLISATKKRVVK